MKVVKSTFFLFSYGNEHSGFWDEKSGITIALKRKISFSESALVYGG